MTQATLSGAPIRALFLDIDGTLIWHGDETVRPAVLHAIDAARERGCEVVLCTGRTRFTAMPIAEQLTPPHGYGIFSNGGVVMHLGTGEVLLRRLMPVAVALEVARAIVAVGAEPYIYEDATGEGEEAARVLHHPELPVGEWADHPRYRPHPQLLEDLPFAPVSVSTFGTIDKIRPLVRHLRERLSEQVVAIETGTEHTWGVEIYVGGVSKRLGLETVAAHLDVDRTEIMAIGDHLNDLEMLRWAGIGVAMGNALPEVKADADWITATWQEDGVARAIERFIL